MWLARDIEANLQADLGAFVDRHKQEIQAGRQHAPLKPALEALLRMNAGVSPSAVELESIVLLDEQGAGVLGDAMRQEFKEKFKGRFEEFSRARPTMKAALTTFWRLQGAVIQEAVKKADSSSNAYSILSGIQGVFADIDISGCSAKDYYKDPKRFADYAINGAKMNPLSPHMVEISGAKMPLEVFVSQLGKYLADADNSLKHRGQYELAQKINDAHIAFVDIVEPALPEPVSRSKSRGR